MTTGCIFVAVSFLKGMIFAIGRNVGLNSAILPSMKAEVAY